MKIEKFFQRHSTSFINEFNKNIWLIFLSFKFSSHQFLSWRDSTIASPVSKIQALTLDIHDVHTFQRYWDFTKLYLFYAKIPTSRDVSYLNQAWYSKTNTSLLEFSISTSHSSIFNEPLTRFDHIRSWINFTFEVQIADPLVGVFPKINEGHIVWIIVNWISMSRLNSGIFWLTEIVDLSKSFNMISNWNRFSRNWKSKIDFKIFA